jgi:Domain of unknown function DUF488
MCGRSHGRDTTLSSIETNCLQRSIVLGFTTGTCPDWVGCGVPGVSPRTMGWRNASFRGYADYMQTSTFRANLDRCIELAKQQRVVLMCAEAVPWRCHRSLIADALVARGIEASEITSGVSTRPHSLTPWAQVTGTQVTYPAGGARSGQSEPSA